MIDALMRPTGEAKALRWLALLIGATFAAHLVLAANVGLGVDEAYTVATSRVLALGTYDHPPLAWWLAGGAATLFGTEAPLAVRMPFILLSVATLWFAFDAGRLLYSPRAGVFAAVAIALAPVLGWTSGSMVLPDGPLDAALMGGLCCLSRALFGDPVRAGRWWVMAGAAAGLACLSKLHGVFLPAGAGLFLLTSRTHRHWLVSRWPYIAGAVALLIFSPFVLWNAEHHWISFAFQAGRARAARLDLAGPFIALGGQAMFLLPWVWGALMISLVRAAWQGPRSQRDWLLVCLAAGPIALFTLIALGGTKTLFHWAAPGYLFACVLLGRDLARDIGDGDRTASWWLRGSTCAIALLFVAVLALAHLPWPRFVAPGGKAVPYPLIETQSWGELRRALAERGLLDKPGTVVGALKWHEAARIDVALGGVLPVRCLCADARGYGVLYDNRDIAGHDIIVVGVDLPADQLAHAASSLGSALPLAPVMIAHAGRPLQVLHLVIVRNARAPG